MLAQDNIDKIYETIINGNILTTKELNSLGFSQNSLPKLIEKGIIERVKKGEYKLSNIKDLINYGKRLIMKDIELAIKCFQKYSELNKEDLEVYFQLFIANLYKEDYLQAFNCLEYIYNQDFSYYQTDCNFYLLLLSFFTEIPEKYQEHLKNIKFKDLKVDFNDRRYKHFTDINQLRNDIYVKRINYAVVSVQNLPIKTQDEKIQKKLISSLLYKIEKLETESKNKILELIESKEYQSLVDYLNDKSERVRLSIIEKTVLKLANEILNIKKSGIIPPKVKHRTKNILLAINKNNYHLALEQSKLCNKEEYTTDIIHLLLVDICDLIDHISPIKEDNQDVNIFLEENNFQEFTTEEYYLATLEDITSYLSQQDIKNAIKSLRGYLNKINKRKYEFLIVNLIKLSIIEGDFSFTNPRTILKMIDEESFTFNLSYYIHYFYQSLSQNNLEKAKIYLTIIANAEKLDQKCVLTSSTLIKIYDKAKKESVREVQKQELPEVVISYHNNTSDMQKKSASNNPIKNIKLKTFVDKDYKILDIEKITSYIIDSKLDVYSACIKMNLTEEETNIILLIFAREYYYQKHPEKGFEFIKAVEQSKNKTPRTMEVFEEILQNRKLFSCQTKNSPLNLPLTLKAKTKEKLPETDSVTSNNKEIVTEEVLNSSLKYDNISSAKDTKTSDGYTKHEEQPEIKSISMIDEEKIIPPAKINVGGIRTNNSFSEQENYIKIINFFKTESFETMIKRLSPKEKTIISLKLGYIDNKYFSNESIANFFKIDEEEVIAITQRVLLAYKQSINETIEQGINLTTGKVRILEKHHKNYIKQ